MKREKGKGRRGTTDGRRKGDERRETKRVEERGRIVKRGRRQVIELGKGRGDRECPPLSDIPIRLYCALRLTYPWQGKIHLGYLGTDLSQNGTR